MADIDESKTDPLVRAVEGLHDCRATHRSAVKVHETFQGDTAWEGLVHIFDLEGHADATVAYAWSSSVEGSDNRKFYAVLHVPPVNSPAAAVRAAIVAEHRSRTGQ